MTFPTTFAITCDAVTGLPSGKKVEGTCTTSQAWHSKASFTCCSRYPLHWARSRYPLQTWNSHIKCRQSLMQHLWVTAKSRASHTLQPEAPPCSWAVDVNETQRVGKKAGDPCFGRARLLVKLSLWITSKANLLPAEPVALEKWTENTKISICNSHSSLFSPMMTRKRGAQERMYQFLSTH